MSGVVALGLTVAISTGAGAQQPAIAVPIVFDSVTVVDVEQGKLLPNQRVIISGTRIEIVGSAGSVSMPKSAQVVNAQGKFLIPGLWDMHTHSDRRADLFYPLFIANGVTGIRDASSSVPLDTLVTWRREILAGTRVGPPRQLLSGQAIDELESCTRTAGLHTCVTAGDTADARHLVDSLKAAGADILKTYQVSDGMHFVLAAEARRVGLPIGGHTSVPATVVSDSGVGLIDHTTLNQEMVRGCLYLDASVEQCQPVAERLARNNTWWVPTWIYPPRIAGRAHTRSLYAHFNTFLQDFWANSGTRISLYDYLSRADLPSPPDPEPMAAYLTSPGSIVDSLGYMYVVRKAGLPVIAGTDALGLDEHNVATAPAGFTLQAELATYAAEGMTPLEVLQTATLNPAKFLRATDSLGTVAAGKLADLVLLDADPLADILNTTRIRGVIANGRYFDRPALDQMLRDARAKAKEPQP